MIFFYVLQIFNMDSVTANVKIMVNFIILTVAIDRFNRCMLNILD